VFFLPFLSADVAKGGDLVTLVKVHFRHRLDSHAICSYPFLVLKNEVVLDQWRLIDLRTTKQNVTAMSSTTTWCKLVHQVASNRKAADFSVYCRHVFRHVLSS